MSDIKYEICVDSIRGVVAARDAGAARVELCAGLIEGGTTPSLGTILVAREVQNIGVHVIIRPRGGDFLYGVEELVAMETDITTIKSANVDGFVFGALHPDGTIDVEVTRRLIERARPASVTFHRAFDMTPDPIAALETLIELGVDRVLTTGQAPTLLEGAELIRELVRVADNRIIVMPGGINERTAARVIEFTGAREYHFAALTPTASGMQFRRHDVFMGGELRPPEYDRLDTHVQPVASIIAAAGKARI